MLFEMALNLKCAFSAISKNIVLTQLVKWHSHMTADVLAVAYLRFEITGANLEFSPVFLIDRFL